MENIVSQAMLYTDGRIAIQLIDIEDMDPYARLSVNITGSQLAEDEITVDNWTLDAELLKGLLASGKYLDTGRTVSSAHVNAPVWKVVCEELLADARKLRQGMKIRKAPPSRASRTYH
ncbi:hypothetical protein [Cupriavidus sp. TMH.W2]|uniref:hypothetical protein n=1 Tax=Cupriavidus sp. TMH.W2 TaxID=3434465 RepID=UPI003D7814D1